MRNWIIIVILFLIMIITAAQCSVISPGQSGPPQIKVTEAHSQAAIAGTNGIVYFTLLNQGGDSDVLLNVETDVAIAEFHESRIDEQGIMRVGPIPNIEIPAGDSVSLQPGGKQVMLINLKHGLTPGEKMRLTLIFQKSGPMVIEAEVREVNRDISLEHHFMQRSLIDK